MNPSHHPAPRPSAADEGAQHPALHWSRGEKALLVLGILSGIGVGTLGLASSYRALEEKAAKTAAQGGWGWGTYAWMLPVGVDLGILVFSIVNLLLVKAEKPLAWVKWIPRLLTVVTIVLNWQTGATLEGKLGHAALAALWVVLSEIAAHLYAAHIGRLKGRSEMERIRFSRWLYSPVGSARVNRLMKTWEITSYETALQRDRALMVYRSQMRAEFGRLWRFKAPEEKLQPLRLAAYGMTIEEALTEPERQADAKDERARRRRLQQAEGRVQEVEAESQVKAAELQAQAAELRAAADLEAAKAESEAAASVRAQQAEADLQVRQAEADAAIKRLTAEARARVAELEAEEVARQDELARKRERDQLIWQSERERLLTEQQDEARRREAEAQQQVVEAELKESAEAATARRIAAQEEQAAAEAEQHAAEARQRAAEAELKAQQDLQAAAEAESRTRVLERQAAEEEAAAAEARLKAAADALKAADLEAEARLTPMEREARQVADMIRDAGYDVEAVKLSHIETVLGVSQGTASGRRKRAVQILRDNKELPVTAQAAARV
ncbi:DUF2637 domain-containing protein [Streptomyces sp. ISL-10]|uniref:DUF2637 domain-containing protein n=1 Tax=Streptomyces sp. ISL-10 TaxID=2819172 RepID=UPI001BEA9A45|nr:DUF2637 domain-containing protein [Streptomyces sp. ISL-10]MBT2369965.1 DUF2637 domain-containing protein [Streptomyces sp. ISL-10]